MKPPIETHKPRMNERQVRYLTGLSSMVRLSFFSRLEVESARAGVGACEEKEDLDSPAGRILAIKLPTAIVKREYDAGSQNGGREGDVREEKRRRKENKKKKKKKTSRKGRGRLINSIPGVPWQRVPRLLNSMSDYCFLRLSLETKVEMVE